MKTKYVFIETNNNGRGDIFTSVIEATSFDEAVITGKVRKEKQSDYDQKHIIYEVAEYDIDEAAKIMFDDGYVDTVDEAMEKLNVANKKTIDYIPDAIIRSQKI